MNLLFESLPYTLVFLLGVFCIKNNIRSGSNIIFFSLFILSAIRYNIGYDYMTYMDIILFGKDYAVDRFEPLERWILILARESFPQIFFIINSFICVYFVKLSVDRLSPNIAVSALAFFCFPNMFLYSLGVVRYWSAIAVLLYASTFLKEKKILPYMALLILSILLHKSAVIGILFIPLFYIRIHWLINIGILIFGFFGGEFILKEILTGVFPENDYTFKLVEYANKDLGSGMTKIPYLFLGFDLLVLFGCQKMLKSSKGFYQLVSIYNFGVVIMFLFSFQNTLSMRLSLPFLVYSIYIIAYIINNRISSLLTYKSKLLVFELFSFIIMFYTISIFNENLGKSQYLPYEIFFIN